MPLEPTSLEDIALLDILVRIYNNAEEAENMSPEMKQRLVDSALVEETGEGLTLTDAGVAMCKSIKHRVEADRIAEEIEAKREIA